MLRELQLKTLGNIKDNKKGRGVNLSGLVLSGSSPATVGVVCVLRLTVSRSALVRCSLLPPSPGCSLNL